MSRLACVALTLLAACNDADAPPDWQPSSWRRSTGASIPVRILHFSSEDLLLLGHYNEPGGYVIMRRDGAGKPWSVVVSNVGVSR